MASTFKRGVTCVGHLCRSPGQVDVKCCIFFDCSEAVMEVGDAEGLMAVVELW